MSDPPIVLGIDPGVSGGSVLLQGQVVLSVHKFTTQDDFIDWVERWGYARHPPDAAYIEQVHSSPQMGVKSAFTFGENFGFLTGVVRSARIPLHRVRPNQWQAGLNLKTKVSRDGKTAHKRELKNRAAELFPITQWTLATCDAVLIARYGQNQMNQP